MASAEVPFLQPIHPLIHFMNTLSKILDSRTGSPRGSPATQSRRPSRHGKEPHNNPPPLISMSVSHDSSQSSTSPTYHFGLGNTTISGPNYPVPSDNWKVVNGRLWFLGSDNELGAIHPNMLPTAPFTRDYIPEQIRSRDILQLDISRRSWTLFVEDIVGEDIMVPHNICGLPVVTLLPRERTKKHKREADPWQDDPIDPLAGLSYQKCLEISRRFKWSSGFCVWMNGHLQLLAPNLSPKKISRLKVPPTLGGLVVSVSRWSPKGTAGKAVAGTTSSQDSAGDSHSASEKQPNTPKSSTVESAPQTPVSSPHQQRSTTSSNGDLNGAAGNGGTQTSPPGNASHTASAQPTEPFLPNSLPRILTQPIVGEPPQMDTSSTCKTSQVAQADSKPIHNLAGEPNSYGTQTVGNSGITSNESNEPRLGQMPATWPTHRRRPRAHVRDITSSDVGQLPNGFMNAQGNSNTGLLSTTGADRTHQDLTSPILPTGEPAHYTPNSMDISPSPGENPFGVYIPGHMRGSWPLGPVSYQPDTIAPQNPKPPTLLTPDNPPTTTAKGAPNSPFPPATPTAPVVNNPLKVRVGSFISTGGLLVHNPKTNTSYLTGSIHAIFAGKYGKALPTRGIPKKRRLRLRKHFHRWRGGGDPEEISIDNVEVLVAETNTLIGRVSPTHKFGPHNIHVKCMFPDVVVRTSDTCLISLTPSSTNTKDPGLQPLLPPPDPPLSFYRGLPLTNFDIALFRDPSGTSGRSICLGAFYSTALTVETVPGPTILTPEVVRGAILYRRFAQPLRNTGGAEQMSGTPVLTKGTCNGARNGGSMFSKGKDTLQVLQEDGEASSPATSRRGTFSSQDEAGPSTLPAPKRRTTSNSKAATSTAGQEDEKWTQVIGFQAFEFAPPGGGEVKGTQDEVVTMLKRGWLCICGATRVPEEMEKWEILGA